MIHFFRNLQFETISFWSGFIAATLFWWLIRYSSPSIRNIWKALIEKIKTFSEELRISSEDRYLDCILNYIQELHLTSSLFSLDEILITPRFMAPPPIFDPEIPPPYEEIIRTLIPYMPDFPEFATAYNADTLDVWETIKNTNLSAIIGHPGIGKTTTLAYITACLARKTSETGLLSQCIPVYLHFTDIDFTYQDDEDPLKPIVYGISPQIPSLRQTRLTELLNKLFHEGRIVLLVDGLDETFSQEMDQAITFIKTILAHFPKIRIVVATSPDDINDLPKLNFSFFSLPVWDSNTQSQFIHKWGRLWSEHIESPGRRWDDIRIDPSLINSWVQNIHNTITPLEFTLSVWAAYAGDSLGPKPTDSIEAFLRRLCVRVPKSHPSLALIASVIGLNKQSTLLENEARQWLLEGKKEADSDQRQSETIQERTDEYQQWEIDPDALPGLLKAGILNRCSGNRIRFVHPIILAYLAGSSIPPTEIHGILSQTPSAMKSAITMFLTYDPELDSLLAKMLRNSKDPIRREQIILCRWISNISQDTPAPKNILSQFSKDIQNEMLPSGLKMRLATAFASTRDDTMLSFFRKLINAQTSFLRKVGILGCGYYRDTQSVSEIIRRLKDSTNVGQAACFALVNIGTKPALEAVKSVLLSGDEQLARAAAEAFASNINEGHLILKEGSTVENISVRRAIIYGLRKINEPWAIEILRKMQIEDSQWVIKDTASQILEDLTTPYSSKPNDQPSLEDLPWLIVFAGEKGLGISPGKPAIDMLLRVLDEGDDEEILAAIDQIKLRGVTNIFPSIYPLYYGDNLEIKEAAYSLLLQLASMGVNIPSLDQLVYQSDVT